MIENDAVAVEVDFGYWRASQYDGRRGLLRWDPASLKLAYDVPGTGNIRVIYGRFGSEDDVRAALDGWERAVNREPVEWVRQAVAEWNRSQIRSFR